MRSSAGIPGKNTHVKAGDQHTLSHTSTVDQGIYKEMFVESVGDGVFYSYSKR